MNRWAMDNDEYAGFLKAAFEDAIEEVLSAHEGISKGAAVLSPTATAAVKALLGGQVMRGAARAAPPAQRLLAPSASGASRAALGLPRLPPMPIGPRGRVGRAWDWMKETGGGTRARLGPWAGSVGAGGVLGSVIPGVGTVGGMAIGGGLGALGRGGARMFGSKPTTTALAETLIASGRIPAGQTADTLVPYLDDLLKVNPKHHLVRDLAEEQIKWMKPRPLIGAGIVGGGLYGGGKLLFGGEGGGEGGGGSGEGMLGLGGTTAGSIAGGALGGYGAYQGAKMLDMPEWARWALALGGAGAGSQIL